MVLVLVLAMSIGITQPVWFMLVLHLALLFVLALTLHSELADDRPDTKNLTEFYLWIAVGGVMGGLFNTLIAPMLFTRVAEYPIAIAAAAWLIPATSHGLRPLAAGAIRGAPPCRSGDRGALCCSCAVPRRRRSRGRRSSRLVIIAYLFCAYKPFQYGACGQPHAPRRRLRAAEQGELMYAQRTFFGVLRVWNLPEHRQHRLSHGTTFHGGQHTEADRLEEPISYYHPTGPIGQVFAALSSQAQGAHVGVVGLGAGGLAAYAQPGSGGLSTKSTRLWNGSHGTSASSPICVTAPRPATSSSEMRDSRWLTPEPGRYRLLILDAFSSDAIPVHLMTREAMALYLDRLTDDGVLMFHISNRHLNLRQLVAGLAAEHRLVGLRAAVPERALRIRSRWRPNGWRWRAVRPRSGWDRRSIRRWTPLSGSEGTRVWTDDFSDIIGVLRPLIAQRRVLQGGGDAGVH